MSAPFDDTDLGAERVLYLRHLQRKGLTDVTLSVGEARDAALDRAVDLGACRGELLQIGLKRVCHDIAAFGELLDMAFHRRVDRGPSLGEFRKILVHDARQDASAFGEKVRMRFDAPVDFAADLLQLRQVFIENPGQEAAAFVEGRRMVGNPGVDFRPGFGKATHVVVQGVGEHGPALREHLGVALQALVEFRTGFLDARQILLQDAGQVVAPFGELHRMGADGFVERGACIREAGKVRIECCRDEVAATFEALGELIRPAFEHRRGGHDEFGEIRADTRLGLLDNSGHALLAGAEGACDLAGTLDKGLVDLTGARL